MRPSYACRVCERAGDDPQVVQPPLPPEPIPRGTAAAGLLAHVIVSKYVDHLPLYRQESILGRLGWEVTRSTLCDQIIACAGVLEPLYRLMCDRVRRSAALHADDTPVVLLAPRRTAHAWVYVGDAANPYTVFDLSVGRSGDAPAAFLKGYTGFVHADGYAGYNPVYEGGATHVGCWMHTVRTQSLVDSVRRVHLGRPAGPGLRFRRHRDGRRVLAAQRDHVADLQRVLPHDDPLDEQLQDPLPAPPGVASSSRRPDPLAERRQVRPDLPAPSAARRAAAPAGRAGRVRTCRRPGDLLTPVFSSSRSMASAW